MSPADPPAAYANHAPGCARSRSRARVAGLRSRRRWPRLPCAPETSCQLRVAGPGPATPATVLILSPKDVRLWVTGDLPVQRVEEVRFRTGAGTEVWRKARQVYSLRTADGAPLLGITFDKELSDAEFRVLLSVRGA